MIELTKNQAQILGVFLSKLDDKSRKDFRGMTNAALGKNGINRKTFDNNQDFMLNHYLLKITDEEKHGIQNWKYYDITPFGAMAFILWQQKNLPKRKIKLPQRFFPDIVKYQPKLEKWLGKIFHDLIINAIKGFEIVPMAILMDSKSKKEITHTTNMIEIMKLNTIGIGVSLDKTYNLKGETVVNVVDKEGKVIKTVDFSEGQDSPDTIIDRFTFLFFLSALTKFRVGRDLNSSTKFYSDDLKDVEGPIDSKGNPPTITDIVHIDLGPMAKSFINEQNIFEKAIPKIQQIVKKDPRLSNLIKQNISEIKNNLNIFNKLFEIQKNF